MVFGDDEDAAEEVSDESLRAETDGYADYTKAGDKGGKADSGEDTFTDGDECDDDNETLPDSGSKSGEGARAFMDVFFTPVVRMSGADEEVNYDMKDFGADFGDQDTNYDSYDDVEEVIREPIGDTVGDVCEVFGEPVGEVCHYLDPLVSRIRHVW